MKETINMKIHLALWQGNDGMGHMKSAVLIEIVL